MVEIPLTKGKFALVDDEDYAWLSQYKWYAQWDPHTNGYYAKRNLPRAGGLTAASSVMHREILGLLSGDKRKGDHRDHNTLNNQRYNLRIGSHHQNARNAQLRSDNTTGYKGVSLYGKRYKSQIFCPGVPRHIGYFDTAEAAAMAYDAKATELYGEFALLNFPQLIAA